MIKLRIAAYQLTSTGLSKEPECHEVCGDLMEGIRDAVRDILYDLSKRGDWSVVVYDLSSYKDSEYLLGGYVILNKVIFGRPA